MEWIGSMVFDDTCPTKKGASHTILTSIEWFTDRASAAALFCSMLSPSVQADEFKKIILDVSHPATYRIALGKELDQVTIKEKKNNSLTFEVLVLSVFEDRGGWRGSGGG
jgi:hypothetical protein